LPGHLRLYPFTARFSQSRSPHPGRSALRASLFRRADDLRPPAPSTQGSDPPHSKHAPIYRHQLRAEGRLLQCQTLPAHLSAELAGAPPRGRPFPALAPGRPRRPRSRNPTATRGGRTCCMKNLLQPLRSSPLEMSSLEPLEPLEPLLCHQSPQESDLE